MQETSWVRSVYLYLMCALSIVLVAVGTIAAVTGAVHTVAPDLGHRDTLDRVGIGVANIATEVVDVFGEATQGDAEELCRDLTDNDNDFQDCVDDQGGGDESLSSIQDGIGEIKSELQSQIRNNSIDQLIRGLLLIGAGLLLFRIHGRRTELFADGLLPSKPPSAVAGGAPEPLPPPPGASSPGL